MPGLLEGNAGITELPYGTALRACNTLPLALQKSKSKDAFCKSRLF